MSKRGGLRTRTRVPRWACLEERYRRWRTVLLVGWALAATAWIALQQLGTSTGWKVAALVLGVLLPLLSTEARERLQRREARERGFSENVRGGRRTVATVDLGMVGAGTRFVPVASASAGPSAGVSAFERPELPEGRARVVREVGDSLDLGVKAPTEASRPDAPGAGKALPPYVRRTRDEELAEALATEPFVLVVGDAAAGKSRTAFKVLRVVHPDRLLVVPARPDRSLRELLAYSLENAVVWLDDLEATSVLTGSRQMCSMASPPVDRSPCSRPCDRPSTAGTPPGG